MNDKNKTNKHENLISFDIETGPLPAEEVLSYADPFPDFEPLPDFDPASVKLGNIKDPAKQQEKIEAARVKHEAEAAGAKGKWEAAKAEYEAKEMDKAALNPLTCEILCIGYLDLNDHLRVDAADELPGGEKEMLERFWASYEKVAMGTSFSRFIGWNIEGFDLPVICARSWFHGLQVPSGVWQQNRYLGGRFIDLMKRFACGQYGKWYKLDHVGRFFGAPGKDDQTDGAHFHEDWRSGDPERRKAAMDYLVQDLRLPLTIAKAMGIREELAGEARMAKGRGAE